VEPVQLQVVCYQLWERLRGRPAGSIAEADLPLDYIGQALQRYYEDALAHVLADREARAAGATERALRKWFSSELITEAGTRGFVQRRETHTGSLSNAAVRVLESRFLVRRETRAGGIWYELVHDSFVDPIRAANGAWFVQHQSPLTRAAQAWDGADRDPSMLFAGAQLKGAQAELEADRDEFGALEHAFLAASEGAQQRSVDRRNRLAIAVAIALIAIMGTLSAWALYSARAARSAQATSESYAESALDARSTAEANAAKAVVAQGTAQAAARAEATARQDAESRRVEAEAAWAAARVSEQKALTEAQNALDAEATAQAERDRADGEASLALSRQLAAQAGREQDGGNFALALLLGIEAGRVADTAEAFEAVRAAFPYLGRKVATLSGHEAEVQGAAWNADESRILTGLGSHGARLGWGDRGGACDPLWSRGSGLGCGVERRREPRSDPGQPRGARLGCGDGGPAHNPLRSRGLGLWCGVER
jgi:hypothetical protein